MDKETIKERITALQVAIRGLGGVPIPWPVIHEYLVPLSKWIDEELKREE